jgi:hypothetical protein
MTSGERDAADAGSQMGGRRAWLGLGLAAVVLGGGAIAYVGHDHDHRATRTIWATRTRSLFPTVDPLAAAAKTDLYATNPPVGALVVLADRSTQQGVPQRRRFSLVLWYSPNGKLCGVWVRKAAVNDAFCSWVNVAGSPKIADMPGLVPFSCRYERGYLWVLGSVPPDVTSVTAVSTAGLTQTVKVVDVPAGADRQFRLFTMTLYSADLSLGTVRFDGTDTSGKVVATKATNALGQFV